ncbi:MAG: XdhC family protein, partial [Oscillibacter sp.]|nr:XdhC family protein [Oscillibacter sp.]
MDDLRVIEALRTELGSGRRAVLCTVTGSEGSAPRGAGARMAVFENGETRGTVGGGRIELLAAEHARGLLGGSETAGARRYSLVHDAGMVCGGDMTLCFSLLGEADAQTLAAWETHLREGSEAYLALDLASGALSVSSERAEGDYTERLCRDGVLYLFGGGHVGQALAPLLAAVDFRVTVLDDRAEIAREALFPRAEAVRLCDYGDLAAAAPITERDFVVVMTHGHAADLAVLGYALARRPAFLACLGSRAKRGVMEETLARQGFSEEEI